jgi:hypothetical protein
MEGLIQAALIALALRCGEIPPRRPRVSSNRTREVRAVLRGGHFGPRSTARAVVQPQDHPMDREPPSMR